MSDHGEDKNLFGDGFEVGQDTSNVWEHTTCNEAHDLITPRCDRLQIFLLLKKCIVETKKGEIREIEKETQVSAEQYNVCIPYTVNEDSKKK